MNPTETITTAWHLFLPCFCKEGFRRGDWDTAVWKSRCRATPEAALAVWNDALDTMTGPRVMCEITLGRDSAVNSAMVDVMCIASYTLFDGDVAQHSAEEWRQELARVLAG